MTDPIPYWEAPQEFDPAIPIDSVREHPSNYNHADEEKLAQLLDSHGFYNAIVVQKSSGLIVVGNHRHRVAAAKGAATIPGFWLDVDDDEAEEILAADNLSARLAVFDEARLLELLRARSESPRGLEPTGYSEDDLAALAKGLEPPVPPGPPDEFPEFGDDIPVDYCCPRCGYEGSGTAWLAKKAEKAAAGE